MKVGLYGGVLIFDPSKKSLAPASRGVVVEVAKQGSLVLAGRQKGCFSGSN
jgi:hypothetical protein